MTDQPAFLDAGPYRRPTLTITEREVFVHTQDFPHLETRAWEALLDWCGFHGIDPKRVPMCSLIVRNVEQCRVEYDEIECDEEGRRVVDPHSVERIVFHRVFAQGEAPPLPWPAELLEVANR